MMKFFKILDFREFLNSLKGIQIGSARGFSQYSTPRAVVGNAAVLLVIKLIKVLSKY
jgi:hypothetical protein